MSELSSLTDEQLEQLKQEIHSDYDALKLHLDSIDLRKYTTLKEQIASKDVLGKFKEMYPSDYQKRLTRYLDFLSGGDCDMNQQYSYWHGDRNEGVLVTQKRSVDELKQPIRGPGFWQRLVKNKRYREKMAAIADQPTKLAAAEAILRNYDARAHGIIPEECEIYIFFKLIYQNLVTIPGTTLFLERSEERSEELKSLKQKLDQEQAKINEDQAKINEDQAKITERQAALDIKLQKYKKEMIKLSSSSEGGKRKSKKQRKSRKQRKSKKQRKS
jgi:hypothetical protein